ncbi:cobalamin biosynthesis protein [Roseivivax jejudonensis]|uniref:Cobalamin biosynthesis protein CobD n=1 Tax=Roseivivax jejudonensis TaxID=1529041 RepID=A0A1X6ZLW9_9RHOB|nr:adenosylcobinamide-phosphate synthase CbiB [Roseivivax jejudonensis]SLN55593.1 cobalamin biosynthesis protein [Roseivivax jejudonensis]
MSAALAMLLAGLIDARVGWPDAVHARIGHPVTWIGALIARLDQRLNDPHARDDARVRAGTVTVIAVLGVVALAAIVVQALLPGGVVGVALTALLAWPFLAVRSMHDHVAAVAEPLGDGDLSGARAAVAMIVGRDPRRLDDAGVARAALESLAENTSDGIVAPLFWGVIGGLPGIALYKAVNTMDSMIGHRTPRHAAFGRTAARLDDLVNLAPARLTGLIFVLVSWRPRAAFGVMWRDAPTHRSPNAGWPEAAMAGALGVRLSGPRVYAEGAAPEPWINDGARDPDAADLAGGLELYRRAMLCLALILAGLALA